MTRRLFGSRLLAGIGSASAVRSATAREGAFAYPAIRPPLRRLAANGLALLGLEMRGAPVVAVRVALPWSLFGEPSAEAGLAQAATALLWPHSLQRRYGETLDAIGGTLETEIDEDAAYLHGTVLCRNFEQFVRVLSSAVLEPGFLAEDLERWKRARAAWLGYEGARPRSLAHKMLSSLLYPSEPLWTSQFHPTQPVGTTAAQIRQYHEQWLRPNGSIVAVAGDIGAAPGLAMIERTLAAWRPIPGTQEAGTPAVSAPSTLHVLDRRGATATRLLFGAPSIDRRATAYPACLVLEQLLCGGWLSRLQSALGPLCDRGQKVEGSFDALRKRSDFRISVSVQGKHTGEAIDNVLKELKLVREELVAEDEIENARQAVICQFSRLLEFQETALRLAVLAEQYGLAKDEWATFVQRVASVSPSTVRQAARVAIPVMKLQIIALGDGQSIQRMVPPHLRVERYDANSNSWPLKRTTGVDG